MNKKDLLGELKIERDEEVESAGKGNKPLRWFLLIAVVGGGLFSYQALNNTQENATPVRSPEPAPAASKPAAPNLAGVKAASTISKSNSSILDASGYVVARRRATVSSKITGKVIEVLVEEGMHVKKGQLLARLDDSIPRAQVELVKAQLISAQVRLEEFHVQIKQARLDLNRTRGLAERNLSSQAELDRNSLIVEALLARLASGEQEINVAFKNLAIREHLLADMKVLAPFDGVVVAKSAQEGEMISPISAGGGFTRTGICTIVDMQSLEVEVDVNEAYINRVYANQPVAVTLNAYPGVEFEAAVIAIIPTADRSKATVRVRIALLNPDERILPDMGVRVAFQSEQSPTG